VSARSIFVGGTSSNAGKSWMATAICAWLRSRGVVVAPFKAQNMSNNSYPCRGGGEIGRAQVAQAEACGLEPEPAMNPILLKPNGNGSSQVVVNGAVWKTLSARDYYDHVDELRDHVLAAYEHLARRVEFIVIEGAGSVSELNLRDVDLANLGLATRLGAPWILVADIERGGVFASVIGTVALLTPEERALFRGFAIKKFRGDRSLFDDGVKILESRTGAPCLGVFPFATDITLDAEDTLALDTQPRGSRPGGPRIAIIRFPCLSNATDFRLLSWAEWIAHPPLAPSERGESSGLAPSERSESSGERDFEFIILPGSKSTVSDLRWLHDTGLAGWITAQHRRGATIVGVCGGFQMLGRRIDDPARVESSEATAEGLGLLPAETVMETVKTTEVRAARSRGGVQFSAYEIHMGRTTIDVPMQAFARLEDGRADGACGAGVIGTYLHGAFEHPAVCAETFGVDVVAVSKADHYRRLGDWFSTYATRLDFLECGS
jgi:adenosylcobyric acid synthase